MGSQTNHNAAYLFSVDGLTPWEKLRVIRNFLTQHKQSLAMAKLNIERTKYELSELDDSKESWFKKEEYKIYEPESLDVIVKCESEITFLEELEQKLIVLTEPTRIEDKTDEEMYEINYYDELTAIIVRKAHCDMIAGNAVSPAVMEEVLRCPPAMKILGEQNLLNLEDLKKLTQIENNIVLTLTEK